MKRLAAIAVSFILALVFAGCASGPSGSGWVALLDGRTLSNWDRVGDANWRIEDGSAVADKGKSGFLVSKTSYRDFQIRAEFWVSNDANSGIFIRMSDRNNITPENSYEVNIFDARPDPSYGTGAIVGVAKVSPMPKAGGHWNTYEITAKGPHMIVVLNGQQTVNVQDARHSEGPIALQYGGGIVKFRKLEIRRL